MDVSGLVLADGDHVAARGRLVRDDRGTWFEPPLPRAAIMIQDPPVAPASPLAVPVTGADLLNVEGHRERNGLTEGWATLAGTWSAHQLQVSRQSLPHDDTADREERSGRWDVPPGPPPAGGWPHLPDGGNRGDNNLDFDLGDLRETGAAVAITTFRPGERQAVLVVAASDADVVEARLRPQLGARLLVIPSHWTRQELRAVRDQLSDHWDDWHIYVAGESSSRDGQPQIRASLTRVLPEIAAWATPLPDGILVLRPWLAPTAA